MPNWLNDDGRCECGLGPGGPDHSPQCIYAITQKAHMIKKDNSQETIGKLTKEEQQLIREHREKNKISRKTLEEKFKNVAKTALEEIEEKLRAAEAALQAASEISEREGIPFVWHNDYATGSSLSYIPNSASKIWNGLLDSDVDFDDLLDQIGILVYNYDYSAGWAASAYHC